jgi:hypothetical protein
MTFHRRHPQQAPQDALDYEIAREQAAALGRLGRALEAALAALANHDRAHAEASGVPAKDPAAVRAGLVLAAGCALWCFVIQRESCGLRDQRRVMIDYRVPREVQNRMGVFGGN